MPYKDSEKAREVAHAYYLANREKLNARRRDLRHGVRVGFDCVCEICGMAFTARRKDARTCGEASCQAELARRRCRTNCAKNGHTRTAERIAAAFPGLTEADAMAVISAQDCGDRDALWLASKGWSQAQRTFAKRRYEQIHLSGRI